MSRPRNPLAARWRPLPCDAAKAAELSTRHGLHPAVARVLVARGWSHDSPQLAEFLEPKLVRMRPPSELAGLDAACERILRARRDGERVCVYGDYDVDGVSSTALMISTLRFLGMEPDYFIPNRFTDGYGMTVQRVEEIAARGVRLIITVDNGVGAVEPIRRAGELGVDVVVTDHHLPGRELPAAVAMVNPNREDAPYEHGRLCGVGVAFKVAHGLLKGAAIDERKARAFLVGLLDLVALGTIADVVPLHGENRIFARHGLNSLMTTARPGLAALLDVAGMRGRSATADTVGFGLGPRLNATGRTGDATLALELLLEGDPARAREIATQLDQLNRRRRVIEEEILTQSHSEAERSVEEGFGSLLVVAGEGWHIGVVGIVAARLAERYNVPAIVLGIEDSVAKGSARSIPGFDIHGALVACEEHLIGYGGHAGAAGLRLRHDRLEPFRRAINGHAQAALASIDRTPVLDIDTDVEGGEVSWEFYDDLQRLQPFGEQNPAPVFRLRGARANGHPSILKEQHLKVPVIHGSKVFDTIGFGLAHRKDVFGSPAVDLLFRPMENRFRGRASLELQLLDARPSTT